MISKRNKSFWLAIFFIVIITLLGFYTKLYSGAGHVWVNNKLGGVFYEIFWCLLAYILFPKSKPVSISSVVFSLTCILEFVQLADNAFLETIRSYFIGRVLIGNSFAWSDFPYYFIGCLLSYLLLRKIEKYK